MLKAEWTKSMRARMTLVMSLSSVVPVIICHLIVVGTSGARFGDILWYLPLIPILIAINWFLSGIILIPLRQLLQATTKLANMDIRQRLEVEPYGNLIIHLEDKKAA